TTPAGGGAKAFAYCRCWTARFMNSVQIGRADFAPSRFNSRLSSKPTHTTHSRSEVNPANHPSRDVPVLPAAGTVNPRARTPAAVPLRITSCSMFTIRHAPRGSSAWWLSGAELFTIGPSEPVTRDRNAGFTVTPWFGYGVHA